MLRTRSLVWRVFELNETAMSAHSPWGCVRFAELSGKYQRIKTTVTTHKLLVPYCVGLATTHN